MSTPGLPPRHCIPSSPLSGPVCRPTAPPGEAPTPQPPLPPLLTSQQPPPDCKSIQQLSPTAGRGGGGEPGQACQFPALAPHLYNQALSHLSGQHQPVAHPGLLPRAQQHLLVPQLCSMFLFR